MSHLQMSLKRLLKKILFKLSYIAKQSKKQRNFDRAYRQIEIYLKNDTLYQHRYLLHEKLSILGSNAETMNQVDKIFDLRHEIIERL